MYNKVAITVFILLYYNNNNLGIPNISKILDIFRFLGGWSFWEASFQLLCVTATSIKCHEYVYVYISIPRLKTKDAFNLL